MKIDRGIEILEKEEEDTFMGSEKDWKSAVKLGYEALKRVKRQSVNPKFGRYSPLPSESK